MSFSIQKPPEHWFPGMGRHLPLPAENSLWRRISREPPARLSDEWPRCFSLEILCLGGSSKNGPQQGLHLGSTELRNPPLPPLDDLIHIHVHIHAHISHAEEIKGDVYMAMVRENEKAFWFRTVKILDQMPTALQAVVATLVTKVC